jgi:uncharacterized protein YsxB (DUF464 family)
MTTASFFTENAPDRFEVKGHSELAKEGQDVLCAAITTPYA